MRRYPLVVDTNYHRSDFVEASSLWAFMNMLDSTTSERKFLHQIFAHPRSDLNVENVASIVLGRQRPDFRSNDPL